MLYKIIDHQLLQCLFTNKSFYFMKAIFFIVYLNDALHVDNLLYFFETLFVWSDLVISMLSLPFRTVAGCTVLYKVFRW